MRRAQVIGLCSLVLACEGEQLPTEPPITRPFFEINDLHIGDAALSKHFAFLPPIHNLGQKPPADEDFDPSRLPVLKIFKCGGTFRSPECPSSASAAPSFSPLT